MKPRELYTKRSELLRRKRLFGLSDEDAWLLQDLDSEIDKVEQQKLPPSSVEALEALERSIRATRAEIEKARR